MKLQGRNLSHRDTGEDVALLQFELGILSGAGKLNIQIDQSEITRKFFGSTTLQAVTVFQRQHGLPPTGTVDEPTAVAINAEVDALKPQSFTVRGKTLKSTGEAAPRQRLYAFDVDLRGAAIYRTVQKPTEMKEHGGFETLAELTSDRKGRYKFNFAVELYKQAERKYADVIVFAVEADEITGRSRLVKSNEYSDRGEVRNLDVIITREVGDKTEYELLMPELYRYLKESKVTLADMASSPDQIAFTAQELDEAPLKIQVAGDAETLRSDGVEQLSHELLYGVGRQRIHLGWPSLFSKKTSELRVGLEKSIKERIIGAYDSNEIKEFLELVRKIAAEKILEYKGANQKVTLDKMLSYALPEIEQRKAFVNSLSSFEGDYEKFWKEHLPNDPVFKDNPELIPKILFTNQLTLISDNHQPLIEELQIKRNLTTTHQLLELSTATWHEILEKTGVPEHITGKDDNEKRNRYTEQIQNMLHAAYPTQKAALMVKTREYRIEDANVAEGVGAFISNNEKFNIAGSRIHEFEEDIKVASPEHHEKVKRELFTMQRIFQVSPNPQVMNRLKESGLNSAYAIASIPEKSFLQKYGNILGGAQHAHATHQKATYIANRSEHVAIKMWETSHGSTPNAVFGHELYEEIMNEFENQVPNYSNLFGRPDICECKHCRSVYSPAAYLVDLLRFLGRGDTNFSDKTPLDMLEERRPDLLHLPLTCENTNTVIPYIDLANEIMEYYTAKNGLDKDAAYDTGETTSEELRANPQNVNMVAYGKLKDAVHPFTLPYHQPLDVIRTYTDQFKVGRYEIMKAMNPEPDAITTKAIDAESLRISEEEYTILTGKNFEDQNDSKELHEYFGFSNAGELEQMAAVTEFLRRSGLKYTELVELVKTKFINPFQTVREYLEILFADSNMDAMTIFNKLDDIDSGALLPSADADIMEPLNEQNITSEEFIVWVREHLVEFKSVITLYQAESKCELDTTYLRTVENVYNGVNASGITDTWSRIHRFIRLWRKLGWSIHELDMMLYALGEDGISEQTISKFSSVILMSKQMKRPLNQLACLWGNIDTYGKKSLYKKLFLNRAVQRIDSAFKADAWGNYLTDESELLKDHIPALLAAFRMSAEDLQVVLSTATSIDNNVARTINLETDALNLANISTIYRFVVLAKALKFRVSDLCMIIRQFKADPFSSWDIQQEKFVNISPAKTFEFCKLAADIKTAGFKPATLQYIFSGSLPAESTLALSSEKVMQTAQVIRAALFVIEQDHPETPLTSVTSEMLSSKLLLTFQAETVDRFMGIIESTSTFTFYTEENLDVVIPAPLAAKYRYIKDSGLLICKGVMTDGEIDILKNLAEATPDFIHAVGELYQRSIAGTIENTATFTTITDTNLAVLVPEELERKYTYIKGSGRLTCKGVMTDGEKNTLENLAGATASFVSAVGELYQIPEEFISDNFYGLFAGNMNETKIKLLDHPEQQFAATLEEKLQFVYENYLPLLKKQLREDAVTQHISAIIGLSEAATAELIKSDLAQLIKDLVQTGYSAVYFKDAVFSVPGLERVDSEINFVWSEAALDPQIPADQFSVRWDAIVAPPESAEYTLVVEVEQADESFDLYVDDVLILQKGAGDTTLSWEYVIPLNGSQLHRLKLEYVDTTQEAGIKLFWKTPTLGLEIVPSDATFPVSVINSFLDKTTLYHRAAKFISGFELNEWELAHLIEFSGDFASIDFMALLPEHWVRINEYVNLRNVLPQAQATLIDVFAEANKITPAPTLSTLTDLLNKATAWDKATISYLINTHFSITPADFKNEITLNKIHNVKRIVSRTGTSVERLAVWDQPDSGLNEQDKWDAWKDKAQQIKRMVKAKYEEADWLQLTGGLSDKIRNNQKQALIHYLLTRPELREWGVVDADSLFEYFLIDVQMGACMDTSRIKQANSAVQLFVTRCLLNLESNRSSGNEEGVSPEYIAKTRWEWMKNYRVWEANRKVFLYPENWLEPEWRDDRSPFFKELESELTQNDITELSVENAFRNYLKNLDEVANLEVCGMYHDTDTEMIHVFARTHNIPYQYYYRTWNKYMKWSSWEKVQLDIRSVDDGDNSGVHLIPVVWKKRMFLFWPEFMEKQEEPPDTGSKTISDTVTGAEPTTFNSLKPDKHWEIRLSWSEYVDGKWTSKQMTKEVIESHVGYKNVSKFTFHRRVSSGFRLYRPLNISMAPFDNDIESMFTLSDIQSKVESNKIHKHRSYFKLAQPVYSNNFMNLLAKDKLNLSANFNTYLDKPVKHKLLNSHQGSDFKWFRMKYPFFYHDAHRTYFVRPIIVTAPEQLRAPEWFKPIIIDQIIDDSFVQFDIPQPPGPDDYKWGDISGNSVPYSNVSAHGSMKSMSKNSSAMKMADSINVGSAFGGLFTKIDPWRWVKHYQKGLEFHTFYHPFSGTYTKNLNRGGIPGLMASDTTIQSDSGNAFDTHYQPNFDQGFIAPKRSRLGDTRTHYQENVCFDVYGANSIYNWELFFHAPLYIATRLSKNGKYAEAMQWYHYIFDPTTDEMPGAGEREVSRYWKVLPFKKEPVKTLQEWFDELKPSSNQSPEAETGFAGSIAEWRDYPFRPHLVARNRPTAYMKNVVIKYVENLVAWGDQLFRRDTMESINEATQLYVIAGHILGPRPEFVPKRGKIKAETYNSLEPKLDDFSNALVQMENIFPFSSEIPAANSEYSGGLLGIGQALYFCIPNNDKLLGHWDTVTDRLYKIRHCMNIDGVERSLALFEPPIDPGMLIKAFAQGLSLGDILNDLSSPPPIYRFNFLIQKATEFCAEVKSLGAALLSALEKKDNEELVRTRANHETMILELMTSIKERQLLEARANRQNLVKSRENAIFRMQHYIDLLGEDSVQIPGIPELSKELTVDSQLPVDTIIPTIETDVDESLVESDESGVKLIPKEMEDLDKSWASMISQQVATGIEGIASVSHFFPNADVSGEPFGVGAKVSFGGSNIGSAISASAKIPQIFSQVYSYEAAQASKMAGFIRREQDWTLQANLAAKEIIPLDKQITAADIRVQSAEKELENHLQQIDNVKQVELFLKDKFTNQELYQWIKEQTYAVYKQSYNMAYNMAKKAEKAYRYEVGNEMASFIQYGYWDNSHQGLMSGEKLHLALKQLDKAYIEENKRELELTKSISLAMLNPLAIIELRETGKCYVSLPEELFDLDFQGHYFRRIKSVSLSIPSIAGPYTTVNCSLRLLKNTIRVNTTMSSEGKYKHNNDEGIWIDDMRFRSSNVPVKSIATSSGQNDSGMFELNFRDERYLPFEGSGAISEWRIELTTDKDLRQFDYSTISDIIIHLSYTARENGGLFKENAVTYIKEFIENIADLTDQPLMRMFSMKHEFSTEWHKFLYPSIEGAEQVLSYTLGKERFPFLVQDRNIVVMKIEVFAKCARDGDYYLILSYTDSYGDVITSPEELTMPQNETYGGLNKVTIEADGAGLNLEELDITKEMSLKLRYGTAPDYKNLATGPDEVEDIFMVVHYKIS